MGMVWASLCTSLIQILPVSSSSFWSCHAYPVMAGELNTWSLRLLHIILDDLGRWSWLVSTGPESGLRRRDLQGWFPLSWKVCPSKLKGTSWPLLFSEDRTDLCFCVRIWEGLTQIITTHWKDWCWSQSPDTLVIWCREPTHWKRPWCWERLRAKG